MVPKIEPVVEAVEGVAAPNIEPAGEPDFVAPKIEAVEVLNGDGEEEVLPPKTELLSAGLAPPNIDPCDAGALGLEVVVRRPPEGFSPLSAVEAGSVLMVAAVEGVLEALLSVLDGAEERDDAEALPKGEAEPPLEDSEDAAPKRDVLFVELPLKTEPEEEVGTLEVAREKLVAADGVMEEEPPPKEESHPLLATFPNAETPGRAGEPPKMEVPAAGLTWLSNPEPETEMALASPKVPELEVSSSFTGVALLPLVRGAGELVFDLANAAKGELLAVSTFDPKIEESGVEDLEEASSLLIISTISGVADFAFSSFGAPKLRVVEEVNPPNPPTELLIGVTEKPVTEAKFPKPSAGFAAAAGLDAAAGGAKPGNAGFA